LLWPEGYSKFCVVMTPSYAIPGGRPFVEPVDD
jgi:hypothetical protein